MTNAGKVEPPGPAAARILLGARLRRAREAAGVTPASAAYAIRASTSKISRLELGRVGVKSRDVTDLLDLYGVSNGADRGGERTDLLALADVANQPGWWEAYADALPSWLEVYVGLESAASIIRTYEAQFIPGLLQTPEYATAVTAAAVPVDDKEAVAERVRLRLARQQLLNRPEAPRIWAVVDEAALRRPIGGRAVMRAQLEHLLEVAELPAVTLQVMPFHYGSHAAEGGAFILLRFTEADLPDLVYLESLAGASYLDDQASVDIYTQAADRLAVDAADPATSTDIITCILSDM